MVTMIEALEAEDLSVARCEVSRSIRVTGITSEEFKNCVPALQRYFGSTKRSGGGPIDTVLLLQEGIAIITFKDHNVIPSILEKVHLKLGPDVKVTIVDSFESGEAVGGPAIVKLPPQRIVVTNITEQAFQNEAALRKYFTNPRRSGGGEVEDVVYHGQGQATVTFKDHTVVPKVLERSHPKLGPKLQVSAVDVEEEEAAATSIPQEPLSFPVDPLVARYLRWKPEHLISSLSQLAVSSKVDDDENAIVVTPTASSSPDWSQTCKESLTTLLKEEVVKADLSILKEAAGKLYPIIMEVSQLKGLQYEFDQSQTQLSVVGDASTVSMLKDRIEETYATVITKEEKFPLDLESFTFFEGCKLGEVESMYPSMKFSMNKTDITLSAFGCIRDLNQLKENLPDLCDHAKILVHLQPLEVQFLKHALPQETVSVPPCTAPFFQKRSFDGAESLFLLCSHQHSVTAENVASAIRDQVNTEEYQLPKSFKSSMLHTPRFQASVQQIQSSHKFEFEIQESRLLVVVGMKSSASIVSQALISYIKEECSTTRDIHLKRGVWRLLNTRLEKKWKDFLDSIGDRGVKVVRSSKCSSKNPSVTIKGEPDMVEEAEAELSQLLSSVCQVSLPVERPGIAKYFKESQGRTILSGIEAQARVCIEMATAREEQEMSQRSALSQRSSKFIKVCSGTTPELMTINVYVGDITEFNRAEVIVNAANESLKHVGGVAAAIAKKGGPMIQEDSDEYVRRRGIVPVGTAILRTKIGNFPPPCKAIVHAVGPTWNRSLSTHDREIALLKKTCRKALLCAKNYGSIAIPAISSGVFGFPIDVCADALVKAAVEFSEMEQEAELCDINFVILKQNTNAFQKAAQTHVKNVSAFQQSATSQVLTTGGVSLDTTTRDTSGPSQLTRTVRRIKPASSPTQSYQQASLQHIKITKGSILDAKASALVNTTDTQLGFGGYVSQALLKAAGTTLKDECAKKAPVPVGGVAVTGAGNLTCKHIMHVVLPNYDGPGGNAEKILRSAVESCLQECTKLNLQSIAIPSIGAGNLNYPDDVVARCLLEEASSFFDQNQGKTSLQLVHFVIFMPRTFQAFQRHFQSLTASSNATVASASDGVEFVPPSLSSEYAPSPAEVYQLTPSLKLEVVQGDISDDDSHVIVNTTNEHLNLSGAGAVSRAILRKGGQVLQADCDSFRAKGGRLSEGSVVVTMARGNLKCKEVFHIVFQSGDEGRFVKTIQVCLQKAEERKHQSIAFPAIGTGISHYPATEAAKGMIKAFQKFTSAKKPRHVKVIRMVLFQDVVYKQFVEAFTAMGKEAGSTGGWVSSVKAGAKAIGSFFSGIAGRGSKVGHDLQQEEEEEEVEEDLRETEGKGSEEEWEDVSEEFGMDIPVDLDEVVITIYGETDRAVQHAEKQIQEVLKQQFVTELLDEPVISLLSQSKVKELEEEAAARHVEIEIEVDRDLHSVKLHGCQANVLYVKDKVRDILLTLNQEKAKEVAAEAVHNHIRWSRQLSGGDDEEYVVSLNYEIEEAYRQKKPTYSCDLGAEKFTIDFDKMMETDLVSRQVVPVKRVDLSEVEKPADWEPMPKDAAGKELHVHLVPLKAGSKEYKEVEDQFTATMVSGSNFKQLVSIERVQNPCLFGQYISRKKEMDKHNPTGHQNERWLFHGTTADSCVKINTQGFNRIFKGKNGVVYGHGVYFARDARYSHNYSAADAQGNRKMYLTRVLTGEFTVGDSSTVIPPPKNPKDQPNVPFDSTVDNVSNPRIFVVYFDSQNYPAYVITYN